MTSSDKKEVPTCGICMDHYTAVIRQPIQCPYCPGAACRQCTSHYLLTTLNDPHCVHCKREWNREFIDTKLTQTFRKGALRLHRRKVLMDRERGRLPAMQVFVEARHDYDTALKVYNDCYKLRRELKKKRNAFQAEFAGTDTLEQLMERLRPINRERSELKSKMAAAEMKMRAANQILHGGQKEARQFIMKCPAEGCRGFLSTAWKCGTCQKFFCADCHAEKAEQRDETHQCNPDAKATASMIKQETRPCPKCGIRISKIEGCDQMWCTACQTTFSWNSGQILLNTVVHNPHYYEYLRRTNNGVIPREAGDVPCGGLPNAYMFTRQVMEIQQLTQEQKTEILDALRCLSDLQYVRLPQYPLRRPANTTQDLDISYLRQEITEEQWGASLERMETSFERKKEVGLILQTMLHVGSEKFTQLQNAPRTPARAELAQHLMTEMRKVRDYTNKSLVEKGIQMGMIVPQITKDWRWARIRKADMKVPVEDEEEEVVAAAPLPSAPVEADPRPSSPLSEEGDGMVLVDLGGEMVEMTREQAAQILT